MTAQAPNPTGAARGFTLIELLVSIGIFSIVVVIITGAITSVIDANKKAQTLTSVVNNLNFTLESMTRAIKTGDNLEVGLNDEPTTCSNNEVTVTNALGGTPVELTYSYNPDGGGSIDFFKDGVGGPITAPEIHVERLCFFRLAGDQPAVMFLVEGAMQLGGDASRSEFHVQTTVAQRALQIPG